MGLLYPFPVSTEETDFVQVASNEAGKATKITVKTYGLPYLFWGYALASLTVVFFLWLAVRAPLEKLKSLGSGLDLVLIHSLEALLLATPLVVLAFFFYEKRLTAENGSLVIEHRLFSLPIRRQVIQLHAEKFFINHHMDAPNVARLKGGDEALGFQNKGYFVLYAQSESQKIFAIDRHSRKADLDSLKKLLESCC